MDAEREEYIKYQSFILTTIMGTFLSAFENTELETHHYIREFGIR